VSETGNGREPARDDESPQSILDRFGRDSQPFKSDTGRYLMGHLLDEYPGVAEAVVYNLIQNVWDNRIEGRKLAVSFAYSSKEKRLQFTATGYKGILDWERYNSLHSAGSLGNIRRGEGAKVLVPIAELVRTETHPVGGEYKQSLWRGNEIWRSDWPGKSSIFTAAFPPSQIEEGQTVITASGVFDEVGDRMVGIEFENVERMVGLILWNWNYLLQDHPNEIEVAYEVDGESRLIAPWAAPELADSEELRDLDVTDSHGAVIGRLARVDLALAKVPLGEERPRALAVCTNDHVVTFQQVYGGPNQNRFFGRVVADFLADSETTDHLRFKSTRAWRATRDTLARLVDDFMRRHAGIERVTDPGVSRSMSEVTAQLNRLLKEEFPEWHPEGGVIEERTKPTPRKSPWIRAPKTDRSSYDPGQDVVLSFEVVNSGHGTSPAILEARASVVTPGSALVYHKVWPVEVPAEDSRKIQDSFKLPDDALPGTFTGRISLVDGAKNPLHDRLVTFEVPAAEPEVEDETGDGHRTPRKTKPAKARRGDALQAPYLARIQEEDGKIYESILDRKEWRVYVNQLSPSWSLTVGEERAQRYHVAKCSVSELGQLLLERRISLLEPDELTKDKLIAVCRKIELEKSTVMAKWARIEGVRSGKLGSPLSR